MNRKGDVATGLYYMFAIILGIIAIVIAVNAVSGIDNAETQAFEIANSLSLQINAMSSIKSGSIMIGFERKIDLEIEKRRDGYHVIVTPYTKSLSQESQEYEETKGDSQESFILSYPENRDLRVVFTGINEICILKKSDMDIAEVMEKC